MMREGCENERWFINLELHEKLCCRRLRPVGSEEVFRDAV